MENQIQESRKQFTFYRSFWDAVKNLPDDERLMILDSIIRYALFAHRPQELPSYLESIFVLIQPTLDTARRKADAFKGNPENKSEGRKNEKAPDKETEKEKKKETETETEKKKEGEGNSPKKEGEGNSLTKEGEGNSPEEEFEVFWQSYPFHRRRNKRAAQEAWNNLSEKNRKIAASCPRIL